MTAFWWESREGQMFGRRLDPGRGHEIDERSFALANVPRRYRDCSLDQIPDEVPHKKPLYAWGRDIVKNINKGRGLLLLGSFGAGKTGAAVSLLREALCVGSYCFFVTAMDLNTIYKSRDETLTRSKIEKIQFLIIDDIGAARDQDFGVHKEIVERIVRIRYNSMLTTVFTTNLESKDFLGHHKTISSIFASEYQPVVCSGVNWRRGGDEPCLV